MTTFRSGWLIVFVVLFTGCSFRGPSGDTGPLGPAGLAARNDSTSSRNTYALKFLGNDSYVRIPYSPDLKAEAITVELWVYVDTLVSQFTPLIAAANVDERNMADGYSIKFESGYCYFRLAQASNIAGACAVSYTPPTKQWIHLAATFERKQATLYINGRQVAQSADSPPIFYGSHGLTVGLGYHTDFGGYSYFHGMLDEIRIWNYARSPRQIRQEMDKKLNGTQDGLVGYWDFDHNEWNPLAIDETRYHNNGLLEGDVYYTTSIPFK